MAKAQIGVLDAGSSAVVETDQALIAHDQAELAKLPDGE